MITVVIAAMMLLADCHADGALRRLFDETPADVRPEMKVYKDSGCCVWCPSHFALPDGRFALVHSRWREADGFEAWCAKLEISLAVSQNSAVISKEW